jgi:Tetratricopeptide repeat
MNTVRGVATLVACFLLQATAWGDGDKRVAREHYRRATKAYEIGQYDEAIREFGEAYKIKDDPSILYNLAQAHRLAGHREEALRTFRMFLLKVPDTPHRADAEARIAELQKPREGPPPAAPTQQEPDDEVSQRYFEEGARRYDAQNYTGAIESFEKARRVKSLPALDYNIGRTYDRLGRAGDALVAYRRYVVATPPPPDLDSVRARIEVLEKRVAAETPEPPPPGPPKPTGKTFIAAGAAIGVVGLGALAGGIACGVLAKQTSDYFSSGSPTWDASKNRRGHEYQTTEGVLLGVGGAAVVTGAVLLAIGARQHHAATELLPTVAPGRASLTLSVPLP